MSEVAGFGLGVTATVAGDVVLSMSVMFVMLATDGMCEIVREERGIRTQ